MVNSKIVYTMEQRKSWNKETADIPAFFKKKLVPTRRNFHLRGNSPMCALCCVDAFFQFCRRKVFSLKWLICYNFLPTAPVNTKVMSLSKAISSGFNCISAVLQLFLICTKIPP